MSPLSIIFFTFFLLAQYRLMSIYCGNVFFIFLFLKIIASILFSYTFNVLMPGGFSTEFITIFRVYSTIDRCGLFFVLSTRVVDKEDELFGVVAESEKKICGRQEKENKRNCC